MSKREALSVVDAQEKRARAAVSACRAFGDERGLRRARLDLASIDRARRALRARPAVQVQAAA